jgi:hypothetical protein
LSLELLHLVRRDVLSRVHDPGDEAGILRGEKAFRNQHEQQAAQRHSRKENNQRGELASQHKIEAALIARCEPREEPLDRACDAPLLSFMRAQIPRQMKETAPVPWREAKVRAWLLTTSLLEHYFLVSRGFYNDVRCKGNTGGRLSDLSGEQSRRSPAREHVPVLILPTIAG